MNRNLFVLFDRLGELTARHPERQVHRVHLEPLEHVIVEQWPEAVPDRIAGHAEHFRIRVDRADRIRGLKFFHAGQAGRDAAFLIESGIDERGSVLERKEAARLADVAHAEGDGRLRSGLLKPQHAGHVVRALSQDRDLEDIRILLQHVGVDFVQILRRLGEVVVADDPLHGAEPRDGVGDVRFQIDPVERTGDDGLTKDDLAFGLGAGKATAIRWPAQRGHPRAQLARQKSLELHGLRQEVQAQFDELGPALDRFLQLGHDHLVPRAADYDQHPVHAELHVPSPSGNNTQTLL